MNVQKETANQISSKEGVFPYYLLALTTEDAVFPFQNSYEYFLVLWLHILRIGGALI